MIEPGETLEHVAAGHGCSVEAIERANHLKATLVKPGSVRSSARAGWSKDRQLKVN